MSQLIQYAATCARVYVVTWLSAAALVAAAPLSVRGHELDAPAERDQAQAEARPRLSAASVVEVESPGEAECGIAIGAKEDLPWSAYVRIRGLPTGAMLSAGQPSTARIGDQAVGERAWVVPLAAIEGLKVKVPRGVAGNSELLVTLVDGDGRVLAERLSELWVTPQASLTMAEKSSSAPSDPAGTASSELAAVEPPRTVVIAPSANKVAGLRQREKAMVPLASEQVAATPPGAIRQPQRGADETTTSALSPSDAASATRGGSAPSEPGYGAVDRPAPSAEDLALAERLVATGEGYLARGDSSIARQYFARAAELGLTTPRSRASETSTAALLPRARSTLPEPNSGTANRPALSSADLAQAERLVARGETYLARGDIAIAREYFERAAQLGLPVAALRMAETQDPRELARRGVHGVKANLDEARRWYQRALELDVPEAEARLRRLGSQ